MTFIAHPSVRIKGTEHSYNPALCQDEHCGSNAKGQHMHCPFCRVFEAYQDPVILRAHYRVKHVDKGLDFAGLKVIRCCNYCEIVGSIKGEKKFRGAHWHCYCCRNGFNRRDEAIKHYKTHFRNPHTTFQIQVTQDINSRHYYESSPEAHPKAYGGLNIAIGTNVELTSLSSEMAKGSLNAASPGFQRDRGTETFMLHTLKDSSSSTGIHTGPDEMVRVTSPSSCSSSSSLTAHQNLIQMESDGDTGSIMIDDGPSTGVGQIRNVARENVQISEELKRYRRSEDLEKRLKKMVQMMECQHHELLQTQMTALRKEFAQDAGHLLNGKSHSYHYLTASSSPDASQNSHSSPPVNDCKESMKLTVQGELMATQDVLSSRKMDLRADEVKTFMDSEQSTLPNKLDSMEIVEVHLHKKELHCSLDNTESNTNRHLLPLGANDNETSPLSTQWSTGKKRFAGHLVTREDKPKLQRTG
ncbi:uncharacterized protein [Pleurodeles waltl]|uniref:uncharacterized protein isoform X2 n=1 Tax=Pleurodeles waltl TaxID=8319 RepID=UPI003709412F